MFRLISRLQQLPPEKKQVITVVSAGAFTAVIVALYFMDVGKIIAPKKIQKEAAAEEIRDALSPLKSIASGFSTLYESTKTELKNFKEQMGNLGGLLKEGATEQF